MPTPAPYGYGSGTFSSPLTRTGWTATADGSFSGSYTPDKALDGNNATCWHTSSSSQPHFYLLDMQSVQSFSGIKLIPRQDNANGFLTDFTVTLSNDGTTFGSPVLTVAAAAVTYAVAGVIYFLGSQSARYIKLNITGSDGGYATIAELNVGTATVGSAIYVTDSSILVPASPFLSDALHQKMKGPPFSTPGGNRGFSG